VCEGGNGRTPTLAAHRCGGDSAPALGLDEGKAKRQKCDGGGDQSENMHPHDQLKAAGLRRKPSTNEGQIDSGDKGQELIFWTYGPVLRGRQHRMR